MFLLLFGIGVAQVSTVMSNQVQSVVQSLIPAPGGVEAFWPLVVLSYATGSRPGDATGAGPGTQQPMPTLTPAHPPHPRVSLLANVVNQTGKHARGESTGRAGKASVAGEAPNRQRREDVGRHVLM